MLVEAKMLRRAINGELRDLFRMGFDPSILRKPYDDAFAILIEFFGKHNSLPGHTRMEALCSHLSGFELPKLQECPDKASVYWEQVSSALLDQQLGVVMQGIIDDYNSQRKAPIQRLLEAITNLRRTLATYGTVDVKGIRPGEVCHAVWEDYLASASGNRIGIPIDPNFPTLVEGFGKWAPGHITTVVSRSGVGKTWLCLIQALQAIMNGYAVLIASMEMTVEELMTRLITLRALIDYDAVLKGKLTQEQQERFNSVINEAIQHAPPWNNLLIVNPAAIRNIESVEAQADQFKASLVVADAFYDFPEEGQERKWEKINENLRLVRQFSLATKRHWMLTAQFNRSAAGTYGASDFNVGGSDYFNQVSNNVIFLIQRPTEKKGLKVIVKLNKGRNAAPQPMMTHCWNFRIPSWVALNIFIEQERSSTIDRRDLV
jgi:hypothetical protein